MSAATRPWPLLRLALRLLARDWRSGELRLMAFAVLIAVASFTTVAFFADRVRLALTQEASQLLGADLVLVSDEPIAPDLRADAAAPGLRQVETVRFPSMVAAGPRTLLVEVKAVGEGYPLKGRLEVTGGDGVQRVADVPPPAGEVWLDERALARLETAVGGRVTVGEREFLVSGRIVADPEANIGFLNMMPRLVLGADDLASTGLVQTGSRIKYRLMLAGPAREVAAFREAAWPRLRPGQRLEDVRDARPEIRSALERAEQFLGLASVLSIVLTAVAVALAARRYASRHQDHVAMLRCLGASRAATVWLHALQVAGVGLLAGVAGCAAGFAAQQVLATLLAPMVSVPLPAPGLMPAVQGIAAGLVMLCGFALPPLAALGRVPALRVLRRDVGAPRGLDLLGHAAGLAAVAALVLWHARDLKLAGIVLGGLLAAGLAAAVAAMVLVRVAAAAGRGRGFVWRFGLSNLGRRTLATTVQVVALGAGLLALLLLSITRADLLESWRASLPPDAPNRFLVNVQTDQVPEVAGFLSRERGAAPVFHPMVRARLVEINGRPVSAASFQEDRARRLVDREFNLSWAVQPQLDNRVVEGRWWGDGPAAPQVSLELGVARSLGIGAGDRLVWQIEGQRLETPVTSLRTVAWDSFRVNFFVLAPPGVLDGFPATHVTSFHLPGDQGAVMDRLVARFPNLLVIDVAAILTQVQTMMGQVVRAVEFLFLFSLLAGLLVLFAAIQTTQDERRHEAALLRTLGASGGRILRMQAVEFGAIGALAGLFAALGASGLGQVLARQVLDVPYTPSALLWLAGLGAGGVGVCLAGLAGTRGVLAAAPMESLRRA